MNCPSCGAAMRLKPDADSFECAYCHTVSFPEKDDDGVRVLGEATGRQCPVCAVALVAASLAKMRIEYCTRCHGMLIPMGVFPSLIGELRAVANSPAEQAAPDPGDLKRHLDCPGCHRRMDTHFYAGPGNVIMDSCEDCSLNWLDHGELMRIVHAPDAPERAPVFETALFDDDTTGTADWTSGTGDWTTRPGDWN